MTESEKYYGVAIPPGWVQVERDGFAGAGDMCLDADKERFVDVPAEMVGRPRCWFCLLIRKVAVRAKRSPAIL